MRMFCLTIVLSFLLPSLMLFPFSYHCICSTFLLILSPLPSFVYRYPSEQLYILSGLQSRGTVEGTGAVVWGLGGQQRVLGLWWGDGGAVEGTRAVVCVCGGIPGQR